MSHVDEGLLHAYLDGAFASGDAQGVEIEAHLALCADCRARLDDARALKDRARDVLHHATPIDVRVPPFEALRTRQQGAPHTGTPAHGAAHESRSTRRLARSQVRLAWAASVVLAVGAGWMANELVRRDADEFAPVQDAAPVSRPEPMSGPEADARTARASSSEEAADADPREGSAGSDVRRYPTGDSSGGRQAAAVRLDALSADPEPQVATSRERQTSEAAAAPHLAQADSPPAPAAVPAAPIAASDEAEPLARTAEKLADRDAEREPLPAVADLLRQRAAEQARADRIPTVPAAPRVDAIVAGITRTAYRPSDVIALDTLPPALASGHAFAGHVALLNDYTDAVGSGLWHHVTAEQAAAALGRQPADIEELRSTETETAIVDGRVLVSQRYRLDGGAQLELIQRPAATPLSRTGVTALRGQSVALPHAGIAFKNLSGSLRGESVVAASRPGLILLLKGPVSQDSLHAITARIR